MKYLQLSTVDRSRLFFDLSQMPDFMEKSFSGLAMESLLKNGPDGEFSPVEQVWHLADLEEEGFFLRIMALLDGTAGNLSDFDGDRVAAERDYKTLSFPAGLEKFRQARDRNIRIFRVLDETKWSNKGHLEGVGDITLCDMPAFLYQHDSAHKTEIENWKRFYKKSK